MTLKNTILTIISSALLATSASALSIYNDLDVYNRLVNTANPLTDYFQISSQDNDGINDLVGYNYLTEQIDTATASFSLIDDSFLDGSETVTITLGSSTLFVDNGSATILLALGGVTGSAFFDLDADGVLQYKLVANTGDFKVVSATLTVTAKPRAVPDGGTTAVLLGMGFLAICAVQRKFALAR